MSNRPPPPPLTPKILKQTTTTIFSTGQNLLIFLLISLFLFSMRVNVELATHFVTSFIDNDPSFKSFIDRNNAPANRTSPTSMITTKRSLLKPQLNSTTFIRDSFDPQLGFSSFVPENGIRASEIIPSTANITSLMILTLGFGASYWFMIDVFIHTYSKVHGIIYVLVLNHFYKRQNSFHLTFSNGSFLGSRRLTAFIAMIWVIRSVFTQLMCLWFLLGIEDTYSFLKFLVRSKYMLISTMTPWDRVFEKGIYGFMVSCFLLDMLMSLVFDMGAWIVMVDSRKNVKDAVKECCHLMSLMTKPAIELKCYEYIVCGAFARWILTWSFGVLFGLAFQSFMEVYFMVAWLMYYLSVKSIDANPSGQPFVQM